MTEAFLQYNFAHIEQLCSDMATRVANIAQARNDLAADIKKLGGDNWEGDTAGAMNNSFAQLDSCIQSLEGVVTGVKLAVDEGNNNMASTEKVLANNWADPMSSV